MNTRTEAYRGRLRNGEDDLSWMDVNSEWGVRAQPSKRGLTLNDINVGSYGAIPENASESLSYTPGGADFNPSELPNIGYTLNTRAEVWAENLGKLYEEAVRGSRVQPGIFRGTPWHCYPTILNTPCASWPRSLPKSSSSRATFPEAGWDKSTTPSTKPSSSWPPR